MLVTIKRKRVDVVDRDCAKRPCFSLGVDKGTFVPGRGYTSYHKKQHWVCWQRHMTGCPHPSVCPQCRSAALIGVTECRWCKVPVVPAADGVAEER